MVAINEQRSVRRQVDGNFIAAGTVRCISQCQEENLLQVIVAANATTTTTTNHERSTSASSFTSTTSASSPSSPKKYYEMSNPSSVVGTAAKIAEKFRHDGTKIDLFFDDENDKGEDVLQQQVDSDDEIWLLQKQIQDLEQKVHQLTIQNRQEVVEKNNFKKQVQDSMNAIEKLEDELYDAEEYMAEQLEKDDYVIEDLRQTIKILENKYSSTKKELLLMRKQKAEEEEEKKKNVSSSTSSFDSLSSEELIAMVMKLQQDNMTIKKENKKLKNQAKMQSNFIGVLMTNKK